MDLIERKRSILKLIREAENAFAETERNFTDIDDYVAEYLTANGVIAPTENKLKQTLFENTLHYLHSFCGANDPDEKKIEHAKFCALFSIIESEPGLEEEYQEWKEENDL